MMPMRSCKGQKKSPKDALPSPKSSRFPLQSASDVIPASYDADTSL
jgi:hypothetical protein